MQRKTLILIISVGLIAIVGLSIGIYYGVQSSTINPNNTTTTTSTTTTTTTTTTTNTISTSGFTAVIVDAQNRYISDNNLKVVKTSVITYQFTLTMSLGSGFYNAYNPGYTAEVYIASVRAEMLSSSGSSTSIELITGMNYGAGIDDGLTLTIANSNNQIVPLSVSNMVASIVTATIKTNTIQLTFVVWSQ
jgi:hypothetical protein